MSWIQSAFGTKISPPILFTVLTLAAVFSAGALLHLLLRFLTKHRPVHHQTRPENPSSGSFQRQLQQLFHLHDSGLDQSHIDALPVFLYKEIMGLKEPFDCAVCLCEFTELDKLRLLPLCSHAFHLDCIDTWLLSNSSCPLCRGVILSPGFSYENPVFVFDDSKEGEDLGGGFVVRDDENENSSVLSGKRVFSVILGKLRSTTNQESEMGVRERREISLDGRRCYSMGSFQYVMADSELQVALCRSGGERGEQNGSFHQHGNGILDGNGNGGVRFGSGRGRGGGRQNWNFTSEGDEDGKRINNRAKGESFSASKIWLWSKKGKFPTSRDVNAILP